MNKKSVHLNCIVKIKVKCNYLFKTFLFLIFNIENVKYRVFLHCRTKIYKILHVNFKFFNWFNMVLLKYNYMYFKLNNRFF